MVRGSRLTGVAAVAKHYLGNNFEVGRTGVALPEGRGDSVDIRVSEATVRELYLPPFLAAIDAGLTGLMGSYNRINGDYACQSRWLIDLVKEDAAWPGCLVPDFMFAVRDPVAAAIAGTDIPGLDELCGRSAAQFERGAIPIARLDDICRRILWLMAEAGLADPRAAADPATLGRAAHISLATRVATDAMVLVRNTGVLPIAPEVASIAVIGPADADAQYVIGGSASVAITPGRCVTPVEGLRARAGTVAIHTEQGATGDVILPVIPSDAWAAGAGLQAEYWAGPGREGEPRIRRREPAIDLEGTPPGLPEAWSARWTGTLVPRASGTHRLSLAMAGIAHLRVGGAEIAWGSREAVAFMGPPCPLNGTVRLRSGEPVDIEVLFESGPAIIAPPLGLMGPTVRLGWQEPDDRPERAAALAATSDVAVVFVGFATSEGMDRSTLALPAGQDELVHRIARANDRTIVVLNGGGPARMPWIDEVAAVLQVWLPGERFGDALASVLFGDAEPGGRLPVTFPRDDTQGPYAGDPVRYPGVAGECRYDEGLLVGYRWFDAAGEEPLFEFGSGLSYAAFRRGPIRAELDGDALTIVVAITNVSDRPGSDVVQLYLEPPGEAGRPPRRLIAFAKLRLDPGESDLAAFRLEAGDLREWADAGPGGGAWRVRPGRYLVHAGSSSRQLYASAAIAVGPDGSLGLAGAAGG
jgi:beta-glucosidase